MDLQSTFTISLPDWIRDELAEAPEIIPTRDERMALVNRLADRNWREGNGGPFAALIAETQTGRIVSVGVNVVLASNISLGHAEVTAIGDCTGLGLIRGATEDAARVATAL